MRAHEILGVPRGRVTGPTRPLPPERRDERRPPGGRSALRAADQPRPGRNRRYSDAPAMSVPTLPAPAQPSPSAPVCASVGPAWGSAARGAGAGSFTGGALRSCGVLPFTAVLPPAGLPTPTTF